MLTFDELLRCRPLIHNERTRTWEIHRDLAEFLDGQFLRFAVGHGFRERPFRFTEVVKRPDTAGGQHKGEKLLAARARQALRNFEGGPVLRRCGVYALGQDGYRQD